jgi:hypothetical protein
MIIIWNFNIAWNIKLNLHHRYVDITVNRSTETPGFGNSVLSTLSILLECQVSRLQDRLSCMLCKQWLRWTPSFEPSGVSKLQDLLPCVLSRSMMRIYSTLWSLGGSTVVRLHSFSNVDMANLAISFTRLSNN